MLLFTALLAVEQGAAVAQEAPRASSLRAAPVTEFDGATALGLALRRLGTVKRVLMIAAHPDDESTQILSTLALGQGAEVAYLSLTRGEGGQNGIGPELQEGLGLLRTEELLAARRLDGARQYFTRAYDYGYSRNADEALSRWPREGLLDDVVAVIRDFRPDVVLSIFSGTPADGHGQHQVAGLMAREGFVAAGDERTITRQRPDLAPHAPAKLYQALWRGDVDAPESLATGNLDPLLGRSPYQVAMASRSRHRSQDMGRLGEPGPQRNLLKLIDARAGLTDTRLFAGVDTLLSQRARSAGATAAAAPLRRYEALVASSRDRFNPLHPDRLVEELSNAVRELDRARQSVASGRLPALGADLDEERSRLHHALALSAGLRIDAFAERETVVPGEEFLITTRFWNGGSRPVQLRDLRPLADGWSVEPLDSVNPLVAPRTLVTRRFRVTAPSDLRSSEPYFLRETRSGDFYSWPEEAREIRGDPFGPPLLRVVAELQVMGVMVPMTEEVTYRGVDLRSGEYRRPLRAVPHASLLLEPQLVLVSTTEDAGATRRLTVRVRNEAPEPLVGTLQLTAPSGWRVDPAEQALHLASGEQRPVEVVVRAPAGIAAGEYSISASFIVGANSFDRGYTLIDYPHIAPRPLYRSAAVAVHVVDVRVPRGLRVGYVTGAGDDTEEVLEQLGVDVRLLGPADLATADLSSLDVIITGIRAYEVRPDLVSHNQRLLEYARRGGTVVVQYNKYEYLEPGIAPFRVGMSRPHGRVTDAAAPVTMLDADHPALSWPNRITPADFEGWVQERGLYFLDSWDQRFTPLLEMADPGEPAQRGSLLIAPLGEGTYVYTGLAFFRQLPAGVHGAYRLFANLISLGTEDR